MSLMAYLGEGARVASDGLTNFRLALIGMVLIGAAGVLALLAASKIVIDDRSFAPAAATLALLVVGALFTRIRGLKTASLLIEILACGIALSLLVLISSYLAISTDYPLADPFLARLDRWLGFDGLALVKWVDGVPVLSWLLMHAYASFAPQLLVLPILLILLRQPGPAFTLVLSYGMAGFAASAISVWFPALGAHVTYGIASQALSSVNLHFGYAFLNEFHAVRDQATFVLSVATAQGILTFPSLHTAVAILCAAAASSHVLLRYPVLVLNVLMVVSTLTHGGHYLIDVLAGMVLALLALLAVAAIQRSTLIGKVSVALPLPTFKAR